MKRSLGRNWGRAAWTWPGCCWGGMAMAQTPEQHWQATPNYPSNNPPNYQPSTAQGRCSRVWQSGAGPPRGTIPKSAAARPTRRPSTISDDRAPRAGPARRRHWPISRPTIAGPILRRIRGRSPGRARRLGPPAAGQPIQGPPVRNAPPQAPFVLSPPEAGALENLLTDWEKRNKEIHVMESKFFRWKYDAVFGNGNQPPPPEKGNLKFSAPDKGLMKIEAKDPKQSEQWLCDGKSIYQFDYPKKLVTEYVMPPEMQGKGIGDGPLPFVFGVEAKKLKQRYFMRIITPPRRAKRGLAGGLSALPATGGRIQQGPGDSANRRSHQGLAALCHPDLFAQRQGPHGLSTAKPIDQSARNPWSGSSQLVEAFDPLRLDEEDGFAPAAGGSRAESRDLARKLARRIIRRNSLPNPDLRTPELILGRGHSIMGRRDFMTYYPCSRLRSGFRLLGFVVLVLVAGCCRFAAAAPEQRKRARATPRPSAAAEARARRERTSPPAGPVDPHSFADR